MAHIDDLIDKIDSIVGAPENETDEERELRRRMIERDAQARSIRREGNRARG